MPAAIDITGRKLGMLTAIRRTDKKTPANQWIWECKCDCGNISETRIGNLTCGRSKSCGCLQRRTGKDSPNFKHGLSQNRDTVEYKRYQRECYDKSQYGLLPEQKAKMIAEQNNSCAICRYPFGQKVGDMHVDHCHSTGRVRGLLCDKCNRGLGYFCDEPESLSKAADYVRANR